MTPELLRVVGRYEIVRLIGRGGMASVHLGRDPGLDREVALKELRRYVNNPELRAPVPARVALAGALNHPSLVSDRVLRARGRAVHGDGVPGAGSLRPQLGQLTPAQVAGVLDRVLAARGRRARGGSCTAT